MDDFDFDAVLSRQPAFHFDAVLSRQPAPDDDVARSLVKLNDLLPPVIETVKRDLADSPTFQLRFAELSPAAREEIVTLRSRLLELIRPIRHRLDALDAHALRSFEQLKADQVPLTNGRVVSLEAPAGTYEVQAQAMRRELLEHVKAGTITRAELDEAVTEVVSYKVNHTKLNYLAKHRGEDVAAAIEKHRRRVPPAPYSGRVKWPEAMED